MKAKEMAAAVNIPEGTFSRWKQSRPELYQRIVKSFECEETMQKLGESLEEALKIIEAYKAKEKGDT